MPIYAQYDPRLDVLLLGTCRKMGATWLGNPVTHASYCLLYLITPYLQEWWVWQAIRLCQIPYALTHAGQVYRPACYHSQCTTYSVCFEHVRAPVRILNMQLGSGAGSKVPWYIYIYIHMSSWLKCKTRWLCYLYWLLLASTHWSLSRSFARPAYSMCGLLFATFSCQHFRSSWLFWLSTRVWQSFTVRLWQRSPVVPMALTIFDVYFSIPNQSSLHWHAQQ